MGVGIQSLKEMPYSQAFSWSGSVSPEGIGLYRETSILPCLLDYFTLGLDTCLIPTDIRQEAGIAYVAMAMIPTLEV